MDQPCAEAIMALINFEDDTGTNHLVAVTETRIFKRGSNTWTELTRSGSRAEFKTSVTDAVNYWSITAGSFVAGDYVRQATSDAYGVWMTGTTGHYYIAVLSGTFAEENVVNLSRTGILGPTLTPGVPSVTTNATIPWYGTEANRIQWVVDTDLTLGRVVAITNGRDWPVYWNGSDATVKLLPVDLADFLTAKAIGSFHNSLFLGNIATCSDTEVTWYKQQIAWSDTGEFDDWTDGNSGVQDCTDFQGEVLTLQRFDDRLLIVTTQCIGCVCYVGGTALFGFVVYARDLGILGPQAVVVVASQLTPELVAEGLVREVVHAVQSERKTLDLDFTDRIAIVVATESAELRAAIERHLHYIESETLAASIRFGTPPAGAEPHEIDGHPLALAVTKAGATA
jgi:hypothetical protein